MDIYGPRDETWLGAAKGSQQYLDQVEQWRQGEIATHVALRDRLAQGDHLRLVDETMGSLDKALGGTATSEQLNR